MDKKQEGIERRKYVRSMLRIAFPLYIRWVVLLCVVLIPLVRLWHFVMPRGWCWLTNEQVLRVTPPLVASVLCMILIGGYFTWIAYYGKED